MPPKEIEKVTLPEQEKGSGKLKDLGGSESDVFNNVLANQAIKTLWTAHSKDKDERQKLLQSTLAAMRGIKPADEIEGMLAVQMIAAHNASMECYRRAMIEEQSFEGRKENLNAANKLSRTYAAQMEALQRYRGKGQQRVTVEHVHVHEGGQAIVGTVQAGGGGGMPFKSEEQPHAPKTIEHNPGIPMPCQDAQRDVVPVASGKR